MIDAAAVAVGLSCAVLGFSAAGILQRAVQRRQGQRRMISEDTPTWPHVDPNRVRLQKETAWARRLSPGRARPPRR